MECCQVQGIEKVFNTKTAQSSLKRYREKGVRKTTKMLLDIIKEQNVEGLSLLDIGGGIGGIQHELIKAGVISSTSVEASSAYTEALIKEAERQGHSDKITTLQGDFVDLANEISSADIVTLDKVICCYDDMRSLVDKASKKTNKILGIIIPKETFLSRVFTVVGNFLLSLSKNPFRSYIHSTDELNGIVETHGLRKTHHQRSGLWQVIVYSRYRQ